MTAALIFRRQLKSDRDRGLLQSPNQNLRAIAIGDHYAPATDDRCTNFSASTCPTHPPLLTTSSKADKLPPEKFHRLLNLAFWGGETSKNINTVSNSP